MSHIGRARDELEDKGIRLGSWRIDEREGENLKVFFVVAPDGLCYHFHQPLAEFEGVG